MRIELRDYQNVALEKVLENLTKAETVGKAKPERNAFSERNNGLGKDSHSGRRLRGVVFWQWGLRF